MKHVRPLYLPPAYQDAPDHGRLILRDGSSASIRVAGKTDLAGIKDFYRRLSPQSRRMRFFSEAKPGEDSLLAMLDSSDPRHGLTLLVWRQIGNQPAVIATGSYVGVDAKRAEFAVAVDDDFHGKGLGGLLLERLSVMAASQGFSHFNAFTDSGNHPMLDVFRSSGFRIHEESREGLVEVDLDLNQDAASARHAQQRDRLFTKASLRAFFNPSSVAVIGASRDPQHPGHQIFVTLLRNQFRGIVYPVNPLAHQVSGVKAYATAGELPDPVDLAVIAVPAAEVPRVVDQCALRGVKALIIISSGFAEAGPAGAQKQQALLDQVRGYGMRMLGPHCLGIINLNPEARMNASLCSELPQAGSVAISSQSGALGMALLAIARKRNLGVSSFVSMGNKADVTGNDLLYYWEDDPNTSVILMYLESFGNPRRFARIAREVSRRKPVLCLKSGSFAARASEDEQILNALFLQSGVIRAESMESMFDLAALLSTQPLPAGNRIHIVSNSHGASVLCRDAGTAGGLEITGMMDVDSSSASADFECAIAASIKDHTCDAVICIYMPVTGHKPDAALAQIESAAAQATKPVLAVIMKTDASTTIHKGDRRSIPCYLFPESAAHALAAAAHYRAWRDTDPGLIPDFDDVDLARARGLLQQSSGGALAAPAARGLLASAGINCATEASAGKKALPFQIELRSHPAIGPVISFSLSGEHRDVLKDISYRLAPLTDLDAKEIIGSIRGYPLLKQHLPDTSVIEELLLRISYLATEIAELESICLDGVTVDPLETRCSISCGSILIRPR